MRIGELYTERANDVVSRRVCHGECRVESVELNENVSGEDVFIKMLSAPITPTDLAHVSLGY